jgi:hypothetical protein
MPTTDTPLGRMARRVLEAIEENPDSFDMTVWWEGPTEELTPDDDVCGSTLCVAGWALHLDGWTLAMGGGTAIKDGAWDTESAALRAFAPSTEAERFDLAQLFHTGEFRARAVLRYVAAHGTFPPLGITDSEALAPYWD